MLSALSAVLFLMASSNLGVTAPAERELTALLNEFLSGASRNDAAVHERFWADDLVYTGSSGRRIGRADILRDVRSASAPKPGDPSTIYTAEDVRVHPYGDFAVVAFRLVGTTRRGDETLFAKYWNTGTFAKRGGRWQAVAWQATKIPRSDEEEKKAKASADADAKARVVALGKAWEDRFNARDVAGLARLYTEDCVRLPNGGATSVGRRALEDAYREELRGPWERNARIAISTEEVVVSGDYAIARGTDMTTEPASGSAAGKWMAACRREPDGTWKYHWSTYNSSPPR